MALSTQPYKGTRDFYPEDKRLQKYIFGVIRKTVEGFGYEEYDAPIVEPLELYLAKTSEEIVSEQTYAFTDRGGRQVTLRPEMTPTVSRMVAARRQELAYPARWYSIPNLWRYERPQKGRLREHWQLNVDLFGIAGYEGDHEIITVADAIMKAFGATPGMYTIRINSRKLVNSMLASLGLDDVQSVALVRLIDRMHKIDPAEFLGLVEAACTTEQRAQNVPQRLVEMLQTRQIESLPPELQTHESVAALKELFDVLQTSGVQSAQFDISLMRGFDYYTDIVFEVFDTNPENLRAIAGGGRYDGLVAQFGVEPIPTVGLGMGDVTLKDFLESHDLLPTLAPDTQLYVALIGNVYPAAQKVLKELRDEGLRVAVDASGRKLDAQIKAAVKKHIPYIMFVGEEEIANERYKLKNLVNGQEDEISVERVITTVAAAIHATGE